MLAETSRKVTPSAQLSLPWHSLAQPKCPPLGKLHPGPHHNSSCDKGPGPPLRSQDNRRRLPVLSSSARVCDGPADQDDPPAYFFFLFFVHSSFSSPLSSGTKQSISLSPTKQFSRHGILFKHAFEVCLFT